MEKKKCSKCGIINQRKNQRYCIDCHLAYMRNWRKTHRLEGLPRKKMNCRSHANTYLRRGKIQKENCIKCGSVNSQMHHEDYDKPLDVIWMCRPCHIDMHNQRRICIDKER